MSPLSVGQAAHVACVLECLAPKPGNVHRGADFEDTSLADFLLGSAAIAPIMDQVRELGVGKAVLEASRSTRAIISTNTNLGQILLLAPLCAVPLETRLTDGIRDVLASLTVDDALYVCTAISAASPGGLGNVDQMDVRDSPPTDLIAAMKYAEDRDMVARQYSRNYEDVLQRIVPWLLADLGQLIPMVDAIVHVHLQCMAEFPDSLIARKCGPRLAQESSDRAAHVLGLGHPCSDEFRRGVVDLDFWLRMDGNRRNPGTTADLVTAGLFALLRDRRIPFPLSFYGRNFPGQREVPP